MAQWTTTCKSQFTKSCPVKTEGILLIENEFIGRRGEMETDFERKLFTVLIGTPSSALNIWLKAKLISLPISSHSNNLINFSIFLYTIKFGCCCCFSSKKVLAPPPEIPVGRILFKIWWLVYWHLPNKGRNEIDGQKQYFLHFSAIFWGFSKWGTAQNWGWIAKGKMGEWVTENPLFPLEFAANAGAPLANNHSTHIRPKWPKSVPRERRGDAIDGRGKMNEWMNECVWV